MAKKIIIIAVIILAILGLAVVGYFRSVPGLKNQTANRPQIEITPKTFDFGEIKFGQVVKQSFKVKNLGNGMLEIKRVATSCACTTAKISQEKINPGQEAELLVTYDTAAMGSGPHGKGKQERIIYIKTNDPVKPQVEVTIHAYVR